MATSPTKIFLTGATGYIGGSVLQALLNKQYEISALVRYSSSSPTLEKLGVIPVVGSLSDSKILEKASSEVDIVIHTADVDLIEPVKALLSGLKQHANARGRPTYLLQTSGTGTLLDRGTKGEYANSKFYDDENHEELYNIPLDRAHQELNRFVLDLPQEHVHSLLFYPGNIYGIGTGQFKKNSTLAPGLIRSAIRNRKVQIVGHGHNYWCDVHIDDVVSAFLLLVDRLLDGTAAIGREGIYFAVSGEETLLNIGEAIAKALHKRGAIKDTTITAFPHDQIASELPLGSFSEECFGGNSRGRASRLRKLGWQPTRFDILSTIEEEVESLLQEN